MGQLVSQSNSKHNWRRDQAKDPYFARALREGWRSRAVFKLDEIQARQHILRPGLACVDLGASPGGWSQYIARKVGPRGQVWALDMRPMEPVLGVTFVQGDFDSLEIFERFEGTLAEGVFRSCWRFDCHSRANAASGSHGCGESQKRRQSSIH